MAGIGDPAVRHGISEGRQSTRADFRRSVRFYPPPPEEQQAQRRQHHGREDDAERGPG